MTSQVAYIDDEPMLCRVFERLLTRSGLSVVTFTDPLKALEYLRDHDVPVVVCDYRMPELTGLEVLDALEHRRPFFLVTGDLAVASLVAGDSRVTGLLTKPFQPELLLSAIREALAAS